MNKYKLTRGNDYERLQMVIDYLLPVIRAVVDEQNPHLPIAYKDFLMATALNDLHRFLNPYCRHLRRARHTRVLNQLLTDMPMYYLVWVSQQHQSCKSQTHKRRMK